jgi:hypothetical protein
MFLSEKNYFLKLFFYDNLYYIVKYTSINIQVFNIVLSGNHTFPTDLQRKILMSGKHPFLNLAYSRLFSFLQASLETFN